MKRANTRRGAIRTVLAVAAASLVVGATAVGCGESVFPTDRVEDESHGEARQGGAVSGRYVPPREVVRAGNRQVGNFSYIGAGDSCSGRMLDGSERLGSFLVESFDGAAFYQGYNCRTIRGGSGLSMHGTGRAVDVFIPTVGGDADNDLGDPVANYLIRNASKLGVQYFIWDRSKWNIEYGGPEYYGGSHPHYDHLHIELTPYAARNLRDFPAPGGGESNCEPFDDVCNSTFKDEIAWAKDRGITNGCGDGEYCPRAAVTRGQAAAFFVRAFDLSGGPDAFDDDDGSPFEGAINALAAEGIVNGCGPREFCPDRKLRRGPLAAMLKRTLRLPSGPDAFSDDDGSPFEDAIDALAAADLTDGCGSESYCPRDVVRRGPMAKFLHRAVTSCRYGPFTDVCDSPFRDDILWMADEGITNGCGGEKFCPRDELTRGQLAVFFDRTFVLPDGPDVFSDDDGHPFEDAINAMAAAGITNGCGSGEYCPDETVTRGQLAAFLSRVLSLPSTTRDAFDDDDGSHFEDAINALAAAGITNGCGDRRFCPDRAVRRGPFAAFLHRASRH